MINDKNQNPPCEYAEEIVSFLYDELEESAKSGFETHLRRCSSCADELAGFVTVHDSIQEWRSEDFAVLATPAFALPATAHKLTDPVSFYDRIRAFFAFPVGLLPASVAFLLLVAGVFWLAANSLKNTELASNKNIATEREALTPVDEESPAANLASDVAGNKNSSINKTDTTNFQRRNDSVKAADAAAAPKVIVQRNEDGNFSSNKVKKSIIRAAPVKINDKKKSKLLDKNNVPTLALDEDQDDSLRLADILEEVSLK